jgi:phosphoribosylformimino-5-aminoimidazole carboxamide ribotide isomerase
VKQIVGGTLADGRMPETNFVSEKPAAWFAELYRTDGLSGGHVIKLGSGNDEAAREALAAWPGGLQVGGGITAENAAEWLDAGASHVIVTSAIFGDGRIDPERLAQMVAAVGRNRLVLDLSCRKRDGSYYVVTDRWQTFTETEVSAESLNQLADSCCEFLVHGVDVEGRQQGVDEELIQLLSEHSPIQCVYAGGVSSFDDLETLKRVGEGRLDVTVGSALDIFGGDMPYREVVEYFRNT